MTKDNALHLILQFGRNEEHNLIAEGKKHEAYQIEHARNTLLYALNKSIKRVREVLEDMTNFAISEHGYRLYNPSFFVADDGVRDMVSEFKSKFNR